MAVFSLRDARRRSTAETRTVPKKRPTTTGAVATKPERSRGFPLPPAQALCTSRGLLRVRLVASEDNRSQREPLFTRCSRERAKPLVSPRTPDLASGGGTGGLSPETI